MADCPATSSPTIATEADPTRGDAVYNEFYSRGGWKYSTWKEFWWHRRHLVKRFGLRHGMTIMEVGCGNGFHTNLFNRMGFRCVGLDRSRRGIAWARKHFPRSTYYCCDISDNLPVDRESFDVVFARGCSDYHYDLMRERPLATTKRLMQFVKPGGVFVMTIVTDRSGRREPDKVWHNRIEDYQEHFSSFGLKWSVDWAEGMAICGLYNEPLA